jgi:replicative DNA helicase
MTEESPFQEDTLPPIVEESKKKDEKPPKHQRRLPNDLESEEAILGALLLQPDAVGALCAEKCLKPEHFHTLGEIYAVIAQKWASSEPIDPITVTGALRDARILETVGGPARVTGFTLSTCVQNSRAYIDSILDKFLLRSVIRIAHDYFERGYEETPGSELVTDLSAAVTALSMAATSKPRRTLKQALHAKLERITNGEQQEGFLKTGITKLDENSALRLGDMVLVTGERKSGKSILAETISTNMVLDGEVVLTFSLEDPEPKYIDRLVAGASRVPMNRHFAGKLTEGDFPKVNNALTRLAGSKLIVRDDVYDLQAIIAVSRQTKIQHPKLALIVIDYAQLVRGPREKNSNREQEVAAVSRAFRLLSMELNVAILLLCQLNSEGATRESRALEQDCTAMWKIVKEGEEETGKRWLTIPFQRNGVSGVGFKVAFFGDIARVENLSESEESQQVNRPNGLNHKAKKTYRAYHDD